MKTNIKTISLSAVMTALLCIIAPITIPTGAVPVSASTFIILLSTLILGAKSATLSCFAYILLGSVGLPVFSGFSGGLAKITGPTGGYITGYLFLSAISGIAGDKFPENKILQFLGMLTGTAVMYLIGTVWFAFQTKSTLAYTLTAGVLPFIGWDFIKILSAIILGNILKKRLIKAKILKSANNV